MEKGSLVEFRLSGDGSADRQRQRCLAVVDRPKDKKHWVVVDAQGQPHTLHPRDVSYEVAGQTYTQSDISSFVREIQPYLEPTNLEVAWELLVEDGETVDPTGMAMLLFSDASPPLRYAAHCLLSDDRLYFKQKGDRYEPRPVSQVKELKHQMTVEAQRQQEWQSLVQRLRQILAGEEVTLSSSDRPWIDALERFATLGDEATHRTPALEILAALGQAETSHQAAFQLLVDLKLWHPHENLFLRRSQIPTQFSQRVLDVAHTCLTSPPPDPSPNRLDLTHLKVYTIDDESTVEIDDGLGVEFLATGQQRLWIHIADPGRLLTPGDGLDLEARRRCTTVYLPTGMIPMFPPELATGPMSLLQGVVCPALSFGVILNPSGEVESYEIHPTLIKPTYRLTYDDVDELLQLGIKAEKELEAIAHWANQRQLLRHAQGAITIYMPESSIKVQGEEVTVSVVENTSSRQLVAEMMILAGEVAGRYGQEHSLPLPFRGQPQPELPPTEELMRLPAGFARDYAIRRCMTRSEVGITPSRHASLGLDTYAQVTSPIRRYSDLLSHFQIKAHLQGEELPFTGEDVKELIQVIGTTAYEAVQVERQTNRYWGLEYLRRHPTVVWQSLMLRWLREHEGLGLVLLEDLGLEIAMRFTRAIEPGDRLEVNVAYCDPRRDMIQLTEVIEAAPQTASM